MQVFSYKPRPGAEAEIYEAIGDITLSMRTVDYLDLPELTITTVPVELNPTERAMYELMVRDMVIELDGAVVDEVRQLHAQAVSRQIFAVVVSGVLLLALVMTLIADQRIVRRLAVLIGGGRMVGVRLVRPLLFSYAVTVASAVVLGRLAAMDRVPFTQLDTAVDHDYGCLWTLGLAGLLAIIPALILAARSTSANTRTR